MFKGTSGSGATTSTSDVSIIETFYAGVHDWMKKDPDKNVISEMQHVQELWQNYLSELEGAQQQRARELTYVVVNQPQILPQHFSYIDVLKAVFLIAIPGILLYRHLDINFRGLRDDDLFGSITYTQQEDGSYQLNAGAPNDVRLFEELVITNEIALANNSAFFKFKEYLDANEELDRYTVAHCSHLLLNEVSQNIQILQKDHQFTTSYQASNIVPAEWMRSLHNICGWYLGAYLQKTQASSQSYTEDQESYSLSRIDAMMEHCYRQVQVNLHVAAARQVSNDFTHQSSTNLFDSFIKYVKSNINLSITPAIIEKHKQRKKLIYFQAAQGRIAMASSDLYAKESIAPSLGLKSDEDLGKFLCEDYTLPDNTFIFPNLSPRTSNEEVLLHILTSNIEFLKLMDKEKGGEESYISAIHHLWEALLDHPQCPVEMKNRRAMLTSPEMQLPLASYAHTIDKTYRSSNISNDTIDAFSEMLNLAEQNGQRNALYTLVNIFFTNQQTNVRPTQKHAYNELLNAYLENKFSHLSPNKMYNFYYKIKHLGTITHKISIKKILRLYISKEALKNLKEISENENLPTLISWYEKVKNHKQTTASVIALQIEINCTTQHLKSLAEELKVILPPASNSRFFPKRPKHLQRILDMIDQGISAAEILFALKNSKSTSRKILSSETKVAQLYRAIEGFFSSDNKGQDQSLVDLLYRINPDYQPASNCASASRSGVSTFNH